jgi:competence protein CoiA
MRIALVDGQRREAEHGLLGVCQGCGQRLVPKVGEVRDRHWAHHGERMCDPWWENETPWHRAWKAQFPEHWQEVRRQAENGEWHIADVKTDEGWVFEFQHSHITPVERRAREAFYSNLIWVVDGTRLKRSLTQFGKVWKEGLPVNQQAWLRRVYPDDCALLREWGAGSNAPVLFDFGVEAAVWWLLPRSADGAREYVAQFSRTAFVQLHSSGTTEMVDDFAKFLKEFSQMISIYNSHIRR